MAIIVYNEEPTNVALVSENEEEKVIVKDREMLANMVGEIDATCVNPTDENLYYHNGQYTDYGLDVKKLKGLIDLVL